MALKVIVALDGMSFDQAKNVMGDLHDEIDMFKVGREMIDRQEAGRVADYLGQHNHRRVFWDSKSHDIPQTVYNAAMVLATYPTVFLFNVHCLGGAAMMQAAAKAAREINVHRGVDNKIGALGVTVLTSMNEKELARVGLRRLSDGNPDTDYVADLVRDLAILAKECGLDGVVASPKEVEVVRKACGDQFLIVTPGVRPAGSAANDQQRIATPAEAIKAGADYLVIGRPITQPETGTMLEAAKRINDEIELALV